MGLAFARAALEAGHAVIASSRNPSKSKDLIEEFTSRGSHWIALDIAASEDEVNAQLDAAIAIHGRIDVLFNNAGQPFSGTIEDTPLSIVRKAHEVNLFGTWAVIKRIVPVMRKQKSGTIITNGSVLGFTSMPTAAVYASTKHALVGLMDVLSWEMGVFGVRAIILEPGGVR
jgi:NAD(P)-dependent dehydrogenase (short-subunit alcohol dehydrogenase family)